MYKFSRDVIFAVFADNVWSTKIKSSKIYNSIDIILWNPVILENKIAKMLNLWHLQNLRASKICTYTVVYLYKHSYTLINLCISSTLHADTLV